LAANARKKPPWGVSQAALDVKVQIFDQVSRALPGAPQLTGSGTITADRIQLNLMELLDLDGPGTAPVPFTNNAITISAPASDTLHVATHRVFVSSGDTRAPQDRVAAP
jgi:hypothetical protein